MIAMPVLGSSAAEIDKILGQSTPPFGVVFEIVENDRAFLNRAVLEVTKYIQQLRQKFPQLHIALVSHGKEQFALMTKQQQKQSTLHKKVRSLIQDEHVTLHVCGTHASWYGIAPEEFPDFVDVAAAGPAQINDYVKLGYTLIRIRK